VALQFFTCQEIGPYVIRGIGVPGEAVEHADGYGNERVLGLRDLLPCCRAIGEDAEIFEM
jgi:hypothetical protein